MAYSRKSSAHPDDVFEPELAAEDAVPTRYIQGSSILARALHYCPPLLLISACCIALRDRLSILAEERSAPMLDEWSSGLGPRGSLPLRLEDLPLHTEGRHIVDRQGRPLRLRCVNWYGAHMASLVPGGLGERPVEEIAGLVNTLGFNCVRLPYSLDLQLGRDGPIEESLGANAGLRDASGLEVLDATVRELAEVGIIIVLNNHQGRAMWCCSEEDGEGLWYTEQYPEDVWLSSLRSLAARYAGEPYVVGYDLRNEPRGVPSPSVAPGLRGRGDKTRPDWGSGRNDTDWAGAAFRGALAVTDSDPSALIIVEGLHFATDLSGVREGPKLHRELELSGRVVYEVHDYCWYHVCFLQSWVLHLGSLAWVLYLCRWLSLPFHSARKRRPLRREALLSLVALSASALSHQLVSFRYFEAELTSKWGYLLDTREAPVWLGEFGTNGVRVTDSWWLEVGESIWWRHLLRYMNERNVDYAYWALNGDKGGEEETFGLLERDYRTLRQPWIFAMLP